jgi:drug/metabolite transporter (DMT)-like permease
MINLNLLAVSMMTTASLLVTVNDALVKEALVHAGTAEVLFFRGLFALVPILIYALLWRRPETLLPRNIKLAFFLSALAALSLFLFTISLRFIPLASAITLAYLSPIMVALASPLLVGERISRLQWSAALTGFAGVVAMTSPALEAKNWIILLPVLVAVTIAGRDIIIRNSIARERTMALVVWTHLLTVGVAALAFDSAWLRFDMRQFGLYAAAAITVSLGTAGMIAALRYASAASMSAVKYSCVLWAGLIGWLAFSEKLSIEMICGGMLIVASGIIIAWHESRKGDARTDTAKKPN